MFFLSMKLLVHQLVNVLCFYFEVRLVHFPPCSAQLDAGVVALDGAERLAGRLEEQSGEGRPDRRTEREEEERRGEPVQPTSHKFHSASLLYERVRHDTSSNLETKKQQLSLN